LKEKTEGYCEKVQMVVKIHGLEIHLKISETNKKVLNNVNMVIYVFKCSITKDPMNIM